MQKKLQHLTIVSLAIKAKSIPYAGPGPGCSSIRAHTHHPWVILVPGTSRHRFVSVFSSPAQQVVFPRFSPSLVHINKERYNNTPCSTRLGLRQGRSLWLTSFPYPHIHTSCSRLAGYVAESGGCDEIWCDIVIAAIQPNNWQFVSS